MDYWHSFSFLNETASFLRQSYFLQILDQYKILIYIHSIMATNMIHFFFQCKKQEEFYLIQHAGVSLHMGREHPCAARAAGLYTVLPLAKNIQIAPGTFLSPCVLNNMNSNLYPQTSNSHYIGEDGRRRCECSLCRRQEEHSLSGCALSTLLAPCLLR